MLFEKITVMVSWSDLQPDLLREIFHRLNNATDAIRVRSVCRSWRNSLPTAAFFPYHHLRLPAEEVDAESPVLRQNTVWSLQSPNSASPGSLVLFDVAENGRRTVLNPILQEFWQAHPSDKANPWILNFLRLRVYERERFYILRETKTVEGQFNHFTIYHSKALVFPYSIWSKPNDLAVLALPMDLESKNLRLWKYGDQTWTVVESSGNFRFQDIAIFEDQFVAVDASGGVFSINLATGQAKELTPPRNESIVPNIWWRLVVSGVDLFLLKEQDKLDFEVYKLEYKQGSKCWIEVNDLGNRVLLWGQFSSFFIEAQECRDCRPNCIYYPDLIRNTTHEFDLQKKGPPKDLVVDNNIADVEQGWEELQRGEAMKWSIATYSINPRSFVSTGFGGLLRDGDGTTRAVFSGKLMDVMSGGRVSEMAKLLEMIHFAMGVFHKGGWLGEKKLHIEFSCSSWTLGLMLPLLPLISPVEDCLSQIGEVRYSCVVGLANANAVEVAKQGLDRHSMFQAWE